MSRPNPDTLVLGATGRIGGILHRVWPVGAARWQGRRIPPGADARHWVELDPLADPQALAAAAQGCRTVLCLAGVTHVRQAAGGNLHDNLTLARAAVTAGAAVGARVILASSAAVYGARGGLLAEETPLTPVSDYGRAKAGMETDAAALGARLGVSVTSLRIGNIAGSDAILGGWRPGFALDRFADGRTPRRSYIGPVTLARVIGALCTTRILPGCLNVAAPGAVEMGALLDAAGLGWTARPAPDTAIAEVRLSVAALSDLVALAPQSGEPEALVAEWRMLESDMRAK